MELNHNQKLHLIEHGYVHIPGVVPRVMVDAALRAINHSVGQGMNVEDMTRFRAQSYCPEINHSPVVADLLNKTPAWELVESAVGAGKLKPVTGAQIALRFPGMQDPPGDPRPHLDGMYTPTNGVPEGTIQNFTMLVGIFLSDLPQPWAGNFTVWPGTHRLFETYFQEHTPQSLLEGMPKVVLPEWKQLLVQAGDIALVHYQTAHSVAPNVSPHVRYALFFRLTHIDHHEHKWECMTDIWREWDGLRDLASSSAVPR